MSDVNDARFNDDANAATRDAIRNAAQNDPATYNWVNDAINVYILHSCEGGIADFPPDNNIILIGQCSSDETLLHELGHDLNVFHTHQNNGADSCDDTVEDRCFWDASGNFDRCWNRDEISQSAFGDNYINLTANQQEQVNVVFHNVMSYRHTQGENTNRLSRCQMDRMTNQGYTDKDWLYSKEPVYVGPSITCNPRDPWYPECLLPFGTPWTKYPTLETALPNSNGKIIVLQTGDYTINTDITPDVEIVSRFGGASISPESPPAFRLPFDLSKSKSPKIIVAFQGYQAEKRKALQAIIDGKKDAELLPTKSKDRDKILLIAQKKKKEHLKNAIDYLLKAEYHAIGNEKIAINFLLAKRYRRLGNCELATKFYKLVANETDQTYLKKKALRDSTKCK